MVLESIENLIDINALNIEEPEHRTGIFDPRRDITKKQQADMFEKVQGLKENDKLFDYDTYFNTAEHIKLIFPDRVGELRLDNEAWQRLKEQVVSDTSAESVTHIAPANWDKPHFSTRGLVQAKILFPEKFSELGINQPKENEIVNKIIERLTTSSFGDDQVERWRNFAQNAFDAKLLFPHRVGEFELNDNTFSEIKYSLERLKETERWEEFAQTAACLKFLFPERFDEIVMDEDTWDNLRDLLKTEDFASYAALYLTILAAKKIDLNDKGLEIIIDDADAANEQTPFLPNQRKF